MSAVAIAALSEAAHDLETLTADVRISGLHRRQRTPIERIRERLDTVAWLINYETASVDIPQNDLL